MPATTQTPAPPAPLTWGSVCVAWLPIALGLIMGTMLRMLVFVFGGGRLVAAGGSILCAALGTVGAMLLIRAGRTEGGVAVALKVSLFWVLLTVGFRATWFGLAIEAGWAGVLLDYKLWKGQPGLVIVLLVAAAPFLLRPRHAKPPSPV